MTMTGSHLRLGINIDHVATVRNARDGSAPDPVRAALLAVEAGADGITAHLREDRRHIRDADIARLKAELSKPLNFEMAATAEMIAIATRTKPHAVCLVPEKREEQTTEGGLSVSHERGHLLQSVARLSDAGIRVSLFVEPDRRTLEICAELKVPVVELHTGSWCHAVAKGDVAASRDEFSRLADAAVFGNRIGLEVHAGHGLDFATAEQLAAVPQFVEFNIGHFLVGEAIFVGLPAAISAMRASMTRGRLRVRGAAA
jgi:pyridoxine 5-phosphate synthase